jgi:hypothetical protein
VLVPGSNILVGIQTTDKFAIDNDIRYALSWSNVSSFVVIRLVAVCVAMYICSNVRLPTERVQSQRFSISEFHWDHPYDCYLSGTIHRLCWRSDEVSSGFLSHHVCVCVCICEVTVQCSVICVYSILPC